uniref:Anaphase-promoting complex subunit 4 n=1 Tax=Glossina austeni TaxID=7395 RepID=A0A1A9VNC3_GLOAU
MAQSASMKQIGARHMNGAIHIMEWSNKMDLIAYGTEKGCENSEVTVQRLNWQKIVIFPPPGEDVKVRSLSWQHDETIIAVGYSNGEVSLLDAEREESISTLKYEEDIKKVYFSKAINIADYRNVYRNKTELAFDFFLPPLPPLNNLGVASKSQEHKSFAKGAPCFLVVILKSGKIFLLFLGALKAGSIDMSQHVSYPDDFEIFDARLSGDFNAMYALVRDGDKIKVLHFCNAILKEYISPMMHLAMHCANILETKNYINNTIQCILEAWETVLLEMDNKLTNYANEQPATSLSADFLELLVFGYATHEIEEFLMQDLTEKGIKKLQTSVDLSYSTIQSLVTKPLQSAAINMFYILNTIKGLARMSYYFEPLIVPATAEEALRQCGALLMKILELQQVLLVVSLIILMFSTDDGSVTKRKFNLEKVGQYLEDKPLQQTVKSDTHHLWQKLLEKNECLYNSSLLYPHEKQLSLIQQRDKMFIAIDSVFEKPNSSITSEFQLDFICTCCSLPLEYSRSVDFIKFSFLAGNKRGSDLMAITTDWHSCLLMEFDQKFSQLSCVIIHLKPGPFTKELPLPLNNLQFVDLQFYNEEVLSLLLLQDNEEKQQSYFMQFSLELMREKFSLHLLPQNLNLQEMLLPQSVFDVVDFCQFRGMDTVCTSLAVSGSRKVASILSDKNKKIVMFEMEIEDDDDELEISQNY